MSQVSVRHQCYFVQWKINYIQSLCQFLAHIVYPSSVNYVFLSNDDKAVLTKKIKKCLIQGWIKVILNFVF